MAEANIKSKAKSMTEGDPAKLILNFAMPLIAGNVIQQLYGFIDTVLVGRFLGVDALAAVGCGFVLMMLIIGFMMGLTAGMTIVTGQRFGAGDHNGVHRSVVTCIEICLGVSIFLAILGWAFGRDILVFMNTPPEILDDALSFTDVFCISIPIGAMMLLGGNLIRALGNSKVPTAIMSISLVFNIVLEPIFLLYFGWGIPGAAWGIVVSQLAAVIMIVYYIYKHVPELHIRRKDWRYNWKFMYAHLRVAVPMAFQASIIGLGIFVIQMALNKLGPTAIASYSASSKIDSIALMPMMSFGIAIGAYTAQNFGAKNFDRIREGVRKCAQMSVGFSVVVGILVILFGTELLSLFVGPEETEALEYGNIYLKITGSTYWILALLFVYRYALQGVGKSFVPTLAGVMELLMRGGAALFLADLMGYAGVCVANPLAWVGSAVPLMIAYYISVYKEKNGPVEEAKPKRRMVDFFKI